MNLDEICYKNTPITKVIIRLDFLTNIQELNENLPAEITDVIKQSFPLPEPRNVISKSLQISKDNVIESKVDSKEWHFHTTERNATLIIKSDSLAIVLNHYISFQKVNEVFLEILNIFFNHYKNINSRRLGLRYINEIKVDEPDIFSWDKYLNQNLLSIFKVTEYPNLIVRAFHNLELVSDDIMLKFQYGMHNPDYPAHMKKRYSFLIMMLFSSVY